MSDDELIEAMVEAWIAAPIEQDALAPWREDDRRAMRSVLAVVRAHDSAPPTALANSGPKERQEAFDALKEELDDALAELAALRAERDALRAEVELWKERAYQLSPAFGRPLFSTTRESAKEINNEQ